MNQEIVDGPRRKNKREIGSIETNSLLTPESRSLFPNGLSASDYLARLLGTESKAGGPSIAPSRLLLSEIGPVGPMDCSRPLVIELFAGSFGWSAGFIAEGFRSIGFEIEHEHYHGPIPQHAALVLKDVLELNGAWFKNAAAIVASPPCQEFSYMAMPWSRAKAIASEYRSGNRDVKKLTALFDACFRIQREAIEAAGHFIPMVVENVRGAQPWVGRAKWNFGSYYLWGDVPALMPITMPRRKSKAGSSDTARANYNPDKTWDSGLKLPNNNSPRRWDEREIQRLCDAPSEGFKTQGMNWSDRSIKGQDFTRIGGQQAEGAKQNGGSWFNGTYAERKERWPESQVTTSSKSNARKAASAKIAKIPFPLARWIAHVWKPKLILDSSTAEAKTTPANG